MKTYQIAFQSLSQLRPKSAILIYFSCSLHVRYHTTLSSLELPRWVSPPSWKYFQNQTRAGRSHFVKTAAWAQTFGTSRHAETESLHPAYEHSLLYSFLCFSETHGESPHLTSWNCVSTCARLKCLTLISCIFPILTH